jgi:hypothetical protein
MRCRREMSNATPINNLPRRLMRDCFLPPLNDWQGRQTGWIPPPWGTVKVDESGFEDVNMFFAELREWIFKYRVKKL